jgi:hypothetical protein
MKRLLVFLICLSGLSSKAFAQLGFSLADGATRVDIPIEIHNNLVVVPVILNNQLPLKFIVDTGVRTSILTEKIYSDILHLAYSKKFTISGPGGEKLVDAYITNNVTIDMPGVHGRGHAMLVLEKDYLELRNSMGSDVHGILGYELFSRFVVKIDYEAKILSLMTPKRFKPSKRYARLPITVEDTKPYYVAELRINDTTSMSAKLMIDTGASHGLFLDSESSPKIVVPQKNISTNIGRGLGGPIIGRMARINCLRVGNYRIPNMIASFPDARSYFDTTRFSPTVYRNGSLGGDVLSRFHIIFDFPHEKIYIRSNVSFRKRKLYYNMSGLSVKANGEQLHEFEIIEVRKNSVGNQADLRAGDKILTINSLPTIDMDLSQINNYLASKPGRKVKMQILRGTEIIQKEFILVNEI